MSRWRLATQWREKGSLTELSTGMPQAPTLALALLFATSGLAHLAFHDSYTRAVPEWLPYRGSLVTISGILELLGAVGLVIPVSRVLAGWCLLALLVAVFPANIRILAAARAANSPSWIEGLLWLRLPLQPLLIWMVYRYSISAPGRRRRSQYSVS